MKAKGDQHPQEGRLAALSAWFSAWCAGKGSKGDLLAFREAGSWGAEQDLGVL